MINHYLRLLLHYIRRSVCALRGPQLLLSALGLLLALAANAQQGPAGFFSEDAGARRAAATSRAAAVLTDSRALTLDEAGLRAALAAAPLESKGSAAKPLVLTLPLPDGTNARFAVREAPVMAPELAAKFPEIKTYVGVGLDDAQATVRLDMTPRGFHAQVLSAKTGDFFLDPATQADTKHYLSFWKRAMPGRQFECGTKESGALQLDAGKDAANLAGRTSGPVLRTYRLAMAATAEYTAYQGGTVALGLAAIVTSVNRVVGVYEKELAVRFVLVNGTASLVYTDAATDPFDNANTGNALLAQNQTNTDALIGTDNYDIGHVFSTASGGVAGLGVVCRAGQKARGTTGTRAPVGDAFDIDYVAHEIGHQCGGSHTFDSTTGSCGGGNRSANTAYEVGSGTTIMAYAGICGATNTQLNSDAYFHVGSYDQILAYLGSTSCAVTTSTGNAPPSISLPASGLVLPIGTPFKLTANGYDTDGDAITYNWEEYDKTATGAATLDAAQVDGVTMPLFRSFSPVASPTRYFPRLSDIIGNVTNLSERLPTVSRELRFRVTVRDQHSGPQGVIGGVNSSAIVSLNSTSAAGPFLVSAPNTAAAAWTGGSTQPVTWDVAGTNANGVNCATVNIRLSTDGGLTYPTLLLAGAPNNGSATVTVPSVATTTARVMVEAADNYFFDISNANFTITAPATACAAPTDLSVSSITAATASVSFTASGSATSYIVTTSPATTTQTVTASPVSLTGLAPGVNYTVNIAASCAAGSTATTATVAFATTAPPVCADITNLAVSVTSTTATVTFTPTAAVTSYTVTTTPATTTQTITGSSINLTGLQPGSAYTVNIVSNCASGGTTTSTIDFGTIPGNDDCAAAVGLIVSNSCVSTSGTITGATQSQPASTCSGDLSASANDVWYSFVATGAPSHVVQLVSTFDGVLEVMAGDCGTLTTVNCSDAAGAGTETVLLPGLTAGTRYYVRVYPYTSNAATVTTGTFTVCVTALNDLVVSDTRAIGGSYRNVTVTGTGSVTLSDVLTIYGTMRVQSGGALRTSTTFYIQGPGVFALDAGATLTEVRAAGLANSTAGSFRFTAFVPSLSVDANYVYAGTAAQVTGSLLPLSVRNLTVNNSAGLSLTNRVNVAQVVRLQSGNLTLGTRRLLLRSSAAGTALVDNTGGVVNGTTAAMQRALTGGVAGPAYRHFSSPVAAMSFDSLRTGGIVPIVNAAYNTSATPGASLPFPTVLGYDESRIGTVTSTYGDFDKGWFSPASLSETMQRTKGYSVNIPATSAPVRFTGTFNTGTQNSGALSRGTNADAGWQLLGNPYPSPLDWSTVTAAQRPGVDAAMYVFQSTGQYAGTYRSFVNGVGGTAAQIEAGSGYFVRVTAAGTAGAVNLTNTNRVTTFGSQNPFGRTTADVRPQLQLRVAGAGFSDDAYLYVEAGATAAVDAEYDAVKMPNSTGLNLAVLAGATPLAIQGLPTLAGTTEVVLPLALVVPAAGSFSFEVADLANFGSATVYLRDAATGTKQVLAAGTHYSFTVAAATASSARFSLVLRPAAALATQGPLAATQVVVYPNPARVSFTVEVPAVPGANRVEAELLNTLGQVVRRQSAALPANGAHFTVPTTGLATGVYTLRLQAGASTVTKRVVIE
ncbi:reprolysin-like metallopeptidase [Hymenobacter bucti]|uniref:Reprolysin-like metallopeptidase n=1 Tax=Hymenobacter bucti TaxID=1844114 RepID=A0ABW4QWK2_9BACT